MKVSWTDFLKYIGEDYVKENDSNEVIPRAESIGSKSDKPSALS